MMRQFRCRTLASGVRSCCIPDVEIAREPGPEPARFKRVAHVTRSRESRSAKFCSVHAKFRCVNSASSQPERDLFLPLWQEGGKITETAAGKLERLMQADARNRLFIRAMCATRLARLKYNCSSGGSGDNNKNNNNNNDDDDTKQSFRDAWRRAIFERVRARGRRHRLVARNSFSLKARERANTQLMKKSRDFN